MTLADQVRAELRQRGFAHVDVGMGFDEYRALATSLGEIVGEERIALRPGAHAYVAKPGPVPLHTDQPQVEVIGWWCERQDEVDGASLLLDTKPIVEGLDDETRTTLRDVLLMTPPIDGGPPTIRWPVLRANGERDDVFCSPWLRSALALIEHQRALDLLRRTLSDAARTTRRISARLQRGHALFVDNRRMLHGRDSIAPGSLRVLRRLWVIKQLEQDAA